VEKVNPELAARDDHGKFYTVRDEAVNAILLNEVLKEHRRVESLEKTVVEQQKENAAMRALLKEHTAQIQKVSAQLAIATPAGGGFEARKSSSTISKPPSPHKAAAFGNEPSRFRCGAAFCFASGQISTQQGAFWACSVRPALVVQNSCFLSIESPLPVKAEIDETEFRRIVVRCSLWR
jgi:uncharacterized coiled-coil protein SlyX